MVMAVRTSVKRSAFRCSFRVRTSLFTRDTLQATVQLLLEASVYHGGVLQSPILGAMIR